MIPKIIHYCWFGRNPLPESALKCIDSWRKFLPDYKIKEWNEDNFDVNIVPYTSEAYQAKKYAFVSDYARFYILYHHGGLYFDTDVEVIKSMEDIVEKGNFMGIELEANPKEGLPPSINPGLGLGAVSGVKLYYDVLQYYADLHFLMEDGSLNQVTIVTHTTKVLLENGLKTSNEIQKVDDIWIYPQDYFNPLDSTTGKLVKTKRTCSIHWYMNSWNSESALRMYIVRWVHRIFGVNSLGWLKKLTAHVR